MDISTANSKNFYTIEFNIPNIDTTIPHKRSEFYSVLKYVIGEHNIDENNDITTIASDIFDKTNCLLFKMRYDLTKMYIYVIKLENGKWYVGKSNNPLKKFKKHKSKNGAAYFTRKHKPIELAYSFNCYKILRFFNLNIETEFCVLEDLITNVLIVKYGIENVQGGSRCGIKYDSPLMDKSLVNKLIFHKKINLDELDDFTVFENTTEGRVNLMQGKYNINLLSEKISRVNVINKMLSCIKKSERTQEVLLLRQKLHDLETEIRHMKCY